MAFSVALARPIAQLKASSTPTIYNKSVPTANTEVSQALSANTKQFIIRVRGHGSTLKLAYVATESGTNYITIPKGCSMEVRNVDLTSTTLYFQCDVASQTVEIQEWV
jgi:hypothetical protein